MSKLVIDQIISILPEVDIDSRRFAEWIWATRHRYGLNTAVGEFIIDPGVSDGLKAVTEIFKDIFPSYYRSSYLFRAILEEDSCQCVKLYIVATASTKGSISVTAAGDEKLLNQVMDTIKEKYRRPQTIEVSILTGFSDTKPVLETVELTETEQALAHQEFYPWMQEPIEELARAFSESKANVMLLVGPPGTGKSTFLRTLMFLLEKEKNGLADQESLLMDPLFGQWMRSFRREGVLGIEDADNLVRSRESGNHQMSMILNTADGVVSGNGKIIISTNLPTIDRVDEALLRPGRNFAVLEFTKLTAEQSNAARASIGMEPAEFDPDGHYTLGEALAHRSLSEIKTRRQGLIGMIPNK